MQKLVIYSLFLLVLVVACSKDSIDTKPSIKIKSINPSQVPVNVPLVIDMEFTDKQGDIDSVFIEKTRINQSVPGEHLFPLLAFQLPSFPEKSKGEIRVTIDYNSIISAQPPISQPGAPNDQEPDTLVLKISLMDKGKNVSDTITTDPIIIERAQ